MPAAARARKPGLYLDVSLGLNSIRDTYCLGVVFTVQRRAADGRWRTLFRRTLDKNSRGWERWEVPLETGDRRRVTGDRSIRSGPQSLVPRPGGEVLRLRLLTDSYSRARDRSWPSWRWALWGQPRVIEVAPDGRRRVRQDLIAGLGEARRFVRLDTDGRERPFDGAGQDSTGATFQRVEPSRVKAIRRGEGRSWQWVEGFAEGLVGARGLYPCFAGAPESWFRHAAPAFYHQPAAEAEGDLAWTTAPVPKKRETAIVFIGGTSYSTADAELCCDGVPLVHLKTALGADARWEENGVELRYLFGGDTRDERITYGLSGTFILRLPADRVTPGKPLRLSVKLGEGAPDAWFMVHGYKNAANAGRLALPPQPEVPCIAAFTPYKAGAAGITGAEFDIASDG